MRNFHVTARQVIVWIVLSGSLFAQLECSKNTRTLSNASIEGFDPRMAPCTGGIYIKIDGHPNPGDPNGFFDIGTVPKDFKLPEPAIFPIKVRIEWKEDPKCFGRYVDIEWIRFL
jgi:hypothetical protein